MRIDRKAIGPAAILVGVAAVLAASLSLGGQSPAGEFIVPAELWSKALREMLFSGGVAAITFGSFMAGFSYRQRQLRAENEAIRALALRDELTGLANRKHFE